MPLIDDEGRLFGRVNVVDAAVVVAVLAAAVAGVALLDPFAAPASESEADEEGVTRYLTLDLGPQPLAVAERVTAGDTDADADLTVTDAYVGPAGGGDGVARVVVRARVDGTAADGSGVALDGEPVRRGDELTLAAAGYEAAGDVLAVDAEGARLPTGTTPVVIDAALPPAVADRVDAGDVARLAGRPVATVEGTVIAPVETRARAGPNGSERPALVGATLRTITISGETYFGDAPVLLGERVGIRTDRYAFAGSVTRWGNASPPGVRTNTTATVRLSSLTPAVADAVEAGLVERRGGVTTARVVERSAAPTPVVVTSADGRVYERAHPRNVTLTLTVELRTRRTPEGLRFHTRPLRVGSRVAFDFGTVAVDGTVVDVGSAEPER